MAARGLEAEAFVQLQRTADAAMQSLVVLLKPRGLSPAQYNVLRILRGAGAKGLPCGEVADRMITRDPDMTRLLDRLEKRSLASRSRTDKDRRVIVTRITDDGLVLLAGLDDAVNRLHKEQLGGLGQGRLKTLIELLVQARANLS